MSNVDDTRRDFLKSAVLGGAAAAAATAPLTGLAQPAAKVPDGAPAKGYQYLRPAESAFVEALVDHMVPADALSPSGTGLGINIFIDRALAGSWGRGDRLYRQGPWKTGVPSQGYQLPLTPAELYRVGIEATNAHCMKAYGKPFDAVGATQREEVLKGLEGGTIVFEKGPPARAFFVTVYQTVMEGMFADPIHGGNAGKAAWKMIGFPGVVATHTRNITTYKNKRFPGEPLGIADVS